MKHIRIRNIPQKDAWPTRNIAAVALSTDAPASLFPGPHRMFPAGPGHPFAGLYIPNMLHEQQPGNAFRAVDWYRWIILCHPEHIGINCTGRQIKVYSNDKHFSMH